MENVNAILGISPQSSSNKFCGDCGSTIDADASFCPNCGKEYKYHEATSQTAVPQANVASQPINQTTFVSEKQAFAVMKRYRDAYRVANTVNSFGLIIKIIAIIIGILSFLIGVSVMGAGSSAARGPDFGAAAIAGVFGGMIIFFGILSGAFFFIVGILVSAQGQVLMASLDNAVNSSPFLTNAHRVKVMSLPNP
jgi:hypothetical protein